MLFLLLSEHKIAKIEHGPPTICVTVDVHIDVWLMHAEIEQSDLEALGLLPLQRSKENCDSKVKLCAMWLNGDLCYDAFGVSRGMWHVRTDQAAKIQNVHLVYPRYWYSQPLLLVCASWIVIVIAHTFVVIQRFCSLVSSGQLTYTSLLISSIQCYNPSSQNSTSLAVTLVHISKWGKNLIPSDTAGTLAVWLSDCLTSTGILVVWPPDCLTSSDIIWQHLTIVRWCQTIRGSDN